MYIIVFGGDPSLITLFGESAGGASVSMHMLSPLSQPYFTRSILQSGAATAPWAVENKQYMKCGNGNMSHLAPDQWNMDEVLRCLHEASADKLRDSEWSPVMEFADFPWVPVIDGEFLVENIETSLKRGNFKKTQLLAGSNFDEARKLKENFRKKFF
ncbi:unnamed protein product [Meloidogyne enterolobii]|uniref:Uncharacterized protein n=1 Tax=Meloidogyne enterolobii TaxID=390850 RepID=A0ACB0Z118_MELEN